MKAILHDQDVLCVGEAAEPSVEDGELLIAVKATSVNRADLLQKRGNYPPPAGASGILGLEAAGEVIEGAGRWKCGDRVMALLPGGGYAERVRIPAAMTMPIPESMTYEQAAAIPEVFLTAYLNMFQLGGLQAGQYVLIHAGASGVGTAAIQLSCDAGAHPIVTAGSHNKLQACRALGAMHAINYKDGPFGPRIRELTDGAGVHLVLDFIGAPYWDQNIASLANDGRLILIGMMGGSKLPQVDLGPLLMRRLQVIGTTLRPLSLDRKAALTADFTSYALPRFTDGRLKPVIDSVWNWEQADEAHAYMEGNRNIGKIVLRVT